MTTTPGTARGSLPLPPPEYAQPYMNALIRQLETIFNQFQAVGPITCGPAIGANSRSKSGLNIVNIPTSATGLKSGDVWSDLGTLKIVP